MTQGAVFWTFCRVLRRTLFVLLMVFCISIPESAYAGYPWPFWVETTELPSEGGVFSFGLSAKGDFEVDCGTDGTLVSNSAPANLASLYYITGNTIHRGGTNFYRYSCNYTTGGQKTVKFRGTATAYRNGSPEYGGANAAISFYVGSMVPVALGKNMSNSNTYFSSRDPDTDPDENYHFVLRSSDPYDSMTHVIVAAAYGDLSEIFPYISSEAGEFPRFIQTFGGTEIKSIPDTLFQHYNNLTGATYMFSRTFEGCDDLGSDSNITDPIPADLFSRITHGADYMFEGTFIDCTNLKKIPADLFENITVGLPGLFGGTFYGCSNLGSSAFPLPGTLFSRITSGSDDLFHGTFMNCTSLTEIPGNLFSGITDSASQMFFSTFEGCSSLESIPNNLFSGITTGASYMFRQTFQDCTSLTSLPESLFASVKTPAEGLFLYTFDDCNNLTGYIPPTFFSVSDEENGIPGLIPYQSGFPAATQMMGAFGDTSLATSCDPYHKVKFETGYDGAWSMHVSCLDMDYPFSVTATGGDFSFILSAQGTFYVDCDGGTLTSDENDVTDGWKIVRDNTNPTTYTCTYENAGTKTIRFAGLAETYNPTVTRDDGNNPVTVPAISFFPSANNVAIIDGNLSAIFPSLGSNYGQQPSFYQTFMNTNISVIPDTLFEDIRYGGDYMFYKTFFGCNNLTSIPEYLFSRINSAGKGMFRNTFQNCDNLKPTSSNPEPIPENLFAFGGNSINGEEELFWGTFLGCESITSIPSGLFSHVNTGAKHMFTNTFFNCFGLGSDPDIEEPIPEDLFSTITTSAENLFDATFYNCSNLTHIPATLFSFGSTENNPNNVNGQSYMFHGTFAGCIQLQSIPATLFKHIKTGGGVMFSQTFKDCKSLKSIPSGLFDFSGPDNVFGQGGMFSSTFEGCSKLGSDPNIEEPIPEDLFSHIRSGAGSMFSKAFKNCTSLTEIPSGLFLSIDITNINAIAMFEETFSGCTGLKTLPTSLFSHYTVAKSGMFQKTFYGCSGLGTTDDDTKNFIPPTLFSGLTDQTTEPDIANFMTDIFGSTNLLEGCPANYYLFDPSYYYDYWTPKVSCLPCPDGSHSLAGSTSCGYALTYDCGIASGNPWTDGNYYITVNTLTKNDIQGHCTTPEGRIFTNWKCGDVYIEPGAPLTMSADTTCTAQWGCDDANNYFLDTENDVCEPGYEIELTSQYCFDWDVLPVPEKLYTIHNVGVYLDSARTQLMQPQVNGEGGQYPLEQIPYATFRGIRDTQTNIPTDPVTSIPYIVSTLDDVTTNFIVTQFRLPVSNANPAIDSNGYITETGFNDLIAVDSNTSLRPSIMNCYGVGLGDVPEIKDSEGHTMGYTGKWYTNPEATGDPVVFTICATDNCDKIVTYYAHWTPNHYSVTYNKGAHADENSENYVDEYDSETGEGGATFDAPYTALSFDDTGIAPAEGYVFVGWTTDSTPIFDDGVLQNEFIGYEYWKRDSNLNVYAAYQCDTENGYRWNSSGTACVNDYSVTYVADIPSSVTVSGMPDPSTETVSANAEYILKPLPTATGYVLSKWSCKYTVDNVEQTLTPDANDKITMPPYDVTCTTSISDCDTGYHWTNDSHTACSNTLNLVWDTKGADNDAEVMGSLPGSCTYKTGTIGLTVPTKTGYDFKGWKVVDWDSSS